MPIIVVGGIDFETNKRYFRSRVSPWVKLWAWGNDLTGDPLTPAEDLPLGGTSFAAPIVSGLAAYLLAHPKYQDPRTGVSIFQRNGLEGVASLIQATLYHLAYKRVPDGPLVPWNGEQWELTSGVEAINSSGPRTQSQPEEFQTA